MKPLKVYFTIIVAIIIISENAYSQHNHGGGGGGSTMGNYSQSNTMTMAMPAQSTATYKSFKVWGKCDMCKARIEKGLTNLDGVTTAFWNKKKQKAYVTYDPNTITLPEIEKRIAALGHDTRKFRATDEAYAKLPECCHYKRKKS